MVIGILQVEIALPGISSLKAKRSLLKRIYNDVKKEYNVSTCELGSQNQWQRSLLGFAMIGSSSEVVHAALTKLADQFKDGYRVDLVDHQIELL